MENTKTYWLVESNGDLSVTVENLEKAKALIESDFAHEKEDKDFDVENCQYTITPYQLTEEEFNNLPESDY